MKSDGEGHGSTFTLLLPLAKHKISPNRNNVTTNTSDSFIFEKNFNYCFSSDTNMNPTMVTEQMSVLVIPKPTLKASIVISESTRLETNVTSGTLFFIVCFNCLHNYAELII